MGAVFINRTIPTKSGAEHRTLFGLSARRSHSELRGKYRLSPRGPRQRPTVVAKRNARSFAPYTV